jgi:hypothetical protein
VSETSKPDGVDASDKDRRTQARVGSERRRKARPELTDEMQTAARLRARGVCECTNQNCWHFRKCKAASVAFMAKRSVLSCVLYCRECARTEGGREQQL